MFLPLKHFLDCQKILSNDLPNLLFLQGLKLKFLPLHYFVLVKKDNQILESNFSIITNLQIKVMVIQLITINKNSHFKNIIIMVLPCKLVMEKKIILINFIMIIIMPIIMINLRCQTVSVNIIIKLYHFLSFTEIT